MFSSSPAPSRRGANNNTNSNSNSHPSSSRRNINPSSNRDQSLEDGDDLASSRSQRESSTTSNANSRAATGLSGRNRYVDQTVKKPSYAYGAPPDPNEVSKRRNRTSSGSGNGSISRQDENPSPDLEQPESFSKPEPAKERYARRKAENAAKSVEGNGNGKTNGKGNRNGNHSELGSGVRGGSSVASGLSSKSIKSGSGLLGVGGKRRAGTQSVERNLNGSEGEDEITGLGRASRSGGESMHHAFLRGPDQEEEDDTSGSMPTSLLRGAQRPSNYPMSPSMRSSEASDSRSFSREQQWADEDEARRNGVRIGQDSSNSWLGSLASSFGRSPKNAKSKKLNKDSTYRPSDQEDEEEEEEAGGGGIDLEEEEDVGNTSKNSNRNKKGRTSKDPTFRPDPNAQDSDSADSAEGKKNHKITRKVSSSRNARGGRDDNDIWRDKRRKGRKGRKSGEDGEDEEDADDDDEENDITLGADEHLSSETGVQDQQQLLSPRTNRNLSRKSSSRRNLKRPSNSNNWSFSQWIGMATAFLLLSFIVTSFLGEKSSSFSFNSSGGYVAPSFKPETSEEVVNRLASIEKFVQLLSSSVEDARSAGKRADQANLDLGKRLTKLEKDSEEANRITKQLKIRIDDSRAESESRVKEVEKKAVEMKKEVHMLKSDLKGAQEKALELASTGIGKSEKESASHDLETSKIHSRVDSLVKDLAEAKKQLNDLASQAQRAQETADAAKLVLESLSHQLPDQMPVRIDKKSGQLKVDPQFWIELDKVYSKKDQVSALEKTIKSVGNSKEETIVKEALEPDWTSFRQANEAALKSLFNEDLNQNLEAKIGSGALLSKSAFLELLHTEINQAEEKLTSKLSIKFNKNSKEISHDILAKVREQNDMFQKSGSWGGGNVKTNAGNLAQQSQSSTLSPTSTEYEDAIDDLSSLKTKKGDASISIRTLIDAALEIYSSDRIAKTDFALYSNGARIIPSMTSEVYTKPQNSRVLSKIPFFSPKPIKGRPAIVALHHDNAPGMCWPFAGEKGKLTVRLADKVSPSDITIEHPSKSITLENSNSAPKKVLVWASVDQNDRDSMKKLEAFHAQKLREMNSPKSIDDEVEEDQDEDIIRKAYQPNSNVYLLAKLNYDIHASRSIQTFPVSSEARSLGLPTQLVRYEFISNFGNKDYTCVYRVRLHGVAVQRD